MTLNNIYLGLGLGLGLPMTQIMKTHDGYLPIETASEATTIAGPIQSMPVAQNVTTLPKAAATALLHQVSRFAPTTLEEVSPLDRALAAIDAAQIKEDITYISSDAMKGRATPSEGLSQTAAYIKARLIEHDWQPGGPGGSFYYTYPLSAYTVAPDKNRVTLSLGNDRMTLRFGKDYYYSTMRGGEAEDLKSEIVFLGEAGRDDFLSKDVRGKWVLCFDNDKDPSERRELARMAGARGLIVIPKDDPADTKYQRDIDARFEMARRGEAYYPDSCVIDEIYLSAVKGREFIEKLSARSGLAVPSLAAQETLPYMGLAERRYFEPSAETVLADNVVGFLAGSDPEKAKEVVLITAHYDHLGERWGHIYNGADDNGSGSAGLMALIESLKELNPGRSIMLMWVSGEEKGLLGSDAWARNPYLPEGTHAVANINIDMIGRNYDTTETEVMLTPTSAHQKNNELTRLAESLYQEEGFTALKSADKYYYRSDQWSFDKYLGIPVIFFTAGTHPDYHQPSDDVELIDSEKIARILRLVVRMVDKLEQ